MKRFATPVALSLLAISTACAPVTRTAHVTRDGSATGDRREFVVNLDSSAFDSNSDVSAKLEPISDGQRLARELSHNTPGTGSDQTTFDLNIGDRAISLDMQAEVLVSVASDLGIMSGLADDG